MSYLTAFWEWITGVRSSRVLEQRLAFAGEQIVALERQVADLKERAAKIEEEKKIVEAALALCRKRIGGIGAMVG